MDYKHIEQLLERYWRCETSLEEENELRSFFMTNDVPDAFSTDKDLFLYQSSQQEIEISPDFEKRMLEMVETPVKIRKVSIIRKLYPLMRAAVVVGGFLMLSNLAQRSLFKDDVTDYNYEAYTDTYTDPEAAYEQVSSALMIISEELNKSQIQQHQVDSVGVGTGQTIDCDE